MNKVSLKDYNNSWFQPGRGVLVRLLWYFTNISILENPLLPFNKLKVIILRLFGASIGKGVVIKPRVNVKYPWNLTIGDYTWIGEGVWIDNLTKVEIGANCCISQGALLLCGNHNYKVSTFDLMVGEIHLKEGSWVGAKAVVCPNVTLNEYALLTAGSTATSDLEESSIYQGNPAMKVKQREINN